MKKVEDSKKSKAKKFKVTVNSILQKDVELEDASISASEDEEDDTRKHQKLLEAVQKLKGQRPTVTQRSEASANISEFDLTEIGKEKVKLNELIKTLKQTTSHVSIKQQLRKVSKKKRLPVPLSKPKADKIKRTIAYSKVSEEVSKWDPVVKGNRSSEQIIFPLRQPEFRLETAEDIGKRKTSTTPLEEEIAELLRGSEHVLTQDRELTPAEEKALKAMSVEEAKLRHKNLQRMRALLSYKEAKARRQSKIKSKKYHRILKKDKMNKVLKDFEELQQTDPDAAQEKLKELDRQRIMERVTLKHRSTGKWAKYQKLRAKYNPESREYLKQQLDLGRTLAEKAVIPDGVNGTIDVATLEKDDRQNLRDNDLLKLYASEGSCQGYGTTNNSVEKIRESKTVIGKPSNIVSTAHLENGEETERGPEGDDDDADVIDEFMDRKNTFEDFDELLKDVEKGSDKKKISKNSKTVNGHKKENPVKRKVSAAADAGFNCPADVLESMVPNDITLGDEGLDDAPEESTMNIEQAFADENVISEFKEDKKAVQNREQPEGIDTFLPGWGSWGGTGIKASKRKKKRFFIKAPVIVRRDDNLGHVIINEDKDKKAAAHQVSELPFPFSSIQQFQSIIRQPIGNTWNPESSFKNLIAPKVITKAGKIIDPIDADTAVLQKEVDRKPSKLLKDEKGKLSLSKTSSKIRDKRNQKKNKFKPKFKK